MTYHTSPAACAALPDHGLRATARVTATSAGYEVGPIEYAVTDFAMLAAWLEGESLWSAADTLVRTGDLAWQQWVDVRARADGPAVVALIEEACKVAWIGADK